MNLAAFLHTHRHTHTHTHTHNGAGPSWKGWYYRRIFVPFDVFTHFLPVCFESWQVTNSALHPIGSELQDKTVEYINTILMIHHFRQWRSFCSKYDVISSFLSTTRTYSSNEWVFKEITRPRKDFICFPRCTILFLSKRTANLLQTCHCPAKFEPTCNCVNLWKQKQKRSTRDPQHSLNSGIVGISCAQQTDFHLPEILFMFAHPSLIIIMSEAKALSINHINHTRRNGS